MRDTRSRENNVRVLLMIHASSRSRARLSSVHARQSRRSRRESNFCVKRRHIARDYVINTLFVFDCIFVQFLIANVQSFSNQTRQVRIIFTRMLQIGYFHCKLSTNSTSRISFSVPWSRGHSMP